MKREKKFRSGVVAAHWFTNQRAVVRIPRIRTVGLSLGDRKEGKIGSWGLTEDPFPPKKKICERMMQGIGTHIPKLEKVMKERE